MKKAFREPSLVEEKSLAALTLFYSISGPAGCGTKCQEHGDDR